MSRGCGYTMRRDWDVGDAEDFLRETNENHRKAMSAYHVAGHAVMGLAMGIEFADGMMYQEGDARSVLWQPASRWSEAYRQALVLAGGPVAEYVAGFLLAASTRDLIVPGGEAWPGYLVCRPDMNHAAMFDADAEAACNSTGTCVWHMLDNMLADEFQDPDEPMGKAAPRGYGDDLSRLTRRVVRLLRPGGSLSPVLHDAAQAYLDEKEMNRKRVRNLIRKALAGAPQVHERAVRWEA